MNYKLLGTIGILGAPFLFIGTAWYADDMGLTGLIYMAGWQCSLIGLYRLRAAGNHNVARGLFYAIFTTLALAQGWNVWTIFDPGNTSLAYQILDLTWPLSNVLMIPLGIAALRARRLAGWYRFVPLAVGFWLPFALLVLGLLGRTPESMSIGGLYSALAWAMLGFVVFQGAGALRPDFKNAFSAA
ncbi:MAG: hypothetical protein H7Y12_15960 [Sphingobacteriaceae bacterium]|nr:hypothetical protein [Cytophagaceae bacterium]